MGAIITGLVSGLLVLLLGWGAKSVFLARRLFLIQPKLFDYTELGDARNTKTLELTVFNGGSRVEEEIKLQLSPAFRYTILASNKAGLAVDAQGIMQFDRLAPKQEMTVVLTAEGGEFRKEHVIGISSKDSVGKIKDSLQEAQLTPVQNVGIGFVILGLFPAAGYLIGHFIIEDIWKDFSPKVEASQHDANLQFTVTSPTTRNITVNAKLLPKYRSAFTVERVMRVGDLVKFDIKLRNPVLDRITYTLMTTSPVSEKRPPGADYIVADVLVFPGADKTLTMSDYLPPSTLPQLISLEVIVDDKDGRVYFDQDIVLK